MSSDTEMEGIDTEGIDEEEEVALDNDKALMEEQQEDEEQDQVLATQEARELEEARKERQELMAIEQQRVAQQYGSSKKASTQEKLEYLLAQSEVFGHFLAGSIAAKATTGKRGSKSSRTGKKGRLTEAEEDAQLLKAAQSNRHTIRLNQQPSILASHCKMHPYQLEGLNWMIKLHDNGINGILADGTFTNYSFFPYPSCFSLGYICVAEMGLGKTLQTISLLAYLREARGNKGPHLVVVPKSVVGNWINEFRKWCPVIKAIKMGGTKEERNHVVKNYLSDSTRKFDVLVTSYEGLLKEKGKFAKIPWKYLIIDEAHRIKNENSSLSKAVRIMSTEFRLLITGTPLQNNLRELWALLNFLMPEIFGDAEQFDEWFSLSDEKAKDNVIKKLHTVLRPFMLRRVKKDVATALPPKKETKLYVGLTSMQQDWYVKCLQKDAHELNKLGGPDRNRLLNVLMQLRKVCNHPYLFDGAEAGPPFVDGPHLWENSAKMQLLQKLLPKLKERDSRVLIFCQMTRVLDILEDYMNLVGHGYCRIDGNTDGEKRDSQITEFNQEGSTKFAFLLSTRAGGLGINLATADVVILFDSDWNPQVDLQAMDRAHRIGQKKPVQVFRFICEGTVEEKIIERAERKLFLDAAVIQQGRLAEQNQSLEKGELMKMVQFGANEILRGKGGTYSDEDIDALIARGEERTKAMQEKLKTDAQHNLADFSLLAEDDTNVDTFTFGGRNYRDGEKSSGTFLNLPQRQRKRLYDQATILGQIGNKVEKEEVKKRKRGLALHDFQLFDMQKLNAILEKERKIEEEKDRRVESIRNLRASASGAPRKSEGVAPGQSQEELLQQAETYEASLASYQLSEDDEKLKSELLAEGFPDWTPRNFRAFCSALESYGRYDFESISRDVMNETGKTLQEVQRYYIAFWSNYQRINDWSKIIEKIEKAENHTVRLRRIRDAIQEKVERHLEDTFAGKYSNPSEVPPLHDLLRYSWPKMKINYFGNRGRGFTDEEDAFLVAMMYRHGYGSAERIRMEIRRTWQFRFDWYFKSRSAAEIQKRCDTLVRMIDRENEELEQKEETELKTQAESNGNLVLSTPKAAKSKLETVLEEEPDVEVN